MDQKNKKIECLRNMRKAVMFHHRRQQRCLVKGGGRRFLELLSQLNNLDEIIIESVPNQTGIVGRVAGLVTFGPESFIYLAGKFPKAQGEASELINKLRESIERLPETDFSIDGVKDY